MQSQAAVTVGDREIRLQSLPVPDSPPPGGAILRVTANGLCGSDYDLYTGHLRKSSPTLAPLPLVSGHEMVGVLELVDEQAAEQWNVRPGDRVAVDPGIRCGRCAECAGRTGDRCRDERRYSTIPLSTGTGLWGGNAQYMVLLPGTFMVEIPPHLDDEDATLFNPLSNAIHWTTGAARVRRGDRVLILGAGQRAFTCAAVAHRAGARQIIVTGLARDRHKAALLSRFGADELIDTTAHDTVSRVRELTDGQGVDVVIDTVPGATAPTKDGLATLRQGGRLVAAGIKTAALDGLDLTTLITQEHQIRGVFGSSAASTRQAVQMLADGDYPFSQLHSHRFGLDDLDQALRILGGEVAGENPLHLTMLPWGA
ncbi:zinc-dependent alcohol dehydrogenase [Actinomadura rugatobispora]|uniref:Zinc-binding dehydrogenase n=1 Tax=Actinomadura rugatobispora TaxID=1994 RepID=A0ABW1AAW7_9ACTN|nr:zinc-binding dehydrogenase [Actinomadura rugatobispora]